MSPFSWDQVSKREKDERRGPSLGPKNTGLQYIQQSLSRSRAIQNVPKHACSPFLSIALALGTALRENIDSNSSRHMNARSACWDVFGKQMEQGKHTHTLTDVRNMDLDILASCSSATSSLMMRAPYYSHTRFEVERLCC